MLLVMGIVREGQLEGPTLQTMIGVGNPFEKSLQGAIGIASGQFDAALHTFHKGFYGLFLLAQGF